MNQQFFSAQDLTQIAKMGLSPDQILQQVKMFRQGLHFSPLVRPSTVSDGICRFSRKEKDALALSFDQAKKYLQPIKFLPASGAATRMFRIPSYFLNRPDKLQELKRGKKRETLSAEQKFMNTFTKGIKNNKFPFINDLKNILKINNLSLDSLPLPGKMEILLEYLLTGSGLNYSSSPKALIPFHTYGKKTRTPLEEHLLECSEYARGGDGLIRIHLTVAEEWIGTFKDFVKFILPRYETKNRKYQVTYSIQDPSTSTIAVDRQNNLVRDKQLRIVFRQGGHGALLENLNSLDQDIIFISNIDNVVPDRFKPQVIFNKKILAGYLNPLINYLSENPIRKPSKIFSCSAKRNYR
jgi:hypothetical protein